MPKNEKQVEEIPERCGELLPTRLYETSKQRRRMLESEIRSIEIEGFGKFVVIKNMTHRPRRYFKLFTSAKRFKEVQIDQYDERVEGFQRGHDNEGNEINWKPCKQ